MDYIVYIKYIRFVDYSLEKLYVFAGWTLRSAVSRKVPFFLLTWQCEVPPSSFSSAAPHHRALTTPSSKFCQLCYLAVYYLLFFSLSGVWWYLIVVLISVFLITKWDSAPFHILFLIFTIPLSKYQIAFFYPFFPWHVHLTRRDL